MSVHIASLRDALKNPHELYHQPLKVSPFPVQFLHLFGLVLFLNRTPVFPPFWNCFELLISPTCNVLFEYYLASLTTVRLGFLAIRHLSTVLTNSYSISRVPTTETTEKRLNERFRCQTRQTGAK